MTPPEINENLFRREESIGSETAFYYYHYYITPAEINKSLLETEESVSLETYYYYYYYYY